MSDSAFTCPVGRAIAGQLSGLLLRSSRAKSGVGVASGGLGGDCRFVLRAVSKARTSAKYFSAAPPFRPPIPGGRDKLASPARPGPAQNGNSPLGFPCGGSQLSVALLS